MSGVEPEVHLRISYICGESLFSLFKRSKLFICHWRAGEGSFLRTSYVDQTDNKAFILSSYSILSITTVGRPLSA